MARSQTLKDPVQHLKDLIVKRGVSGYVGTSVFGACCVWDPNDHTHSDTYDDALAFLRETHKRDPEEYGRLLFELTHCENDLFYQIPDYFGASGCMIYLRRVEAKKEVAITFVFPLLDAKEFEDDIEILSHISSIWAKIAHCEINQVRLFANESFLKWVNMEEENLLYTEYESN
jgi:hypothetical protein